MFKKIIFLAMFLVIGSHVSWAAPDKYGVVSVVEGDVLAKRPGESDFSKIAPGARLPQGSIVTTSTGALCHILLGDSQTSAIKLKENSRALLFSLDPVKVNLDSGKIFTLVRGLKKGSGFEVRTPTAVAAARGCGWAQTRHSLGVFEDSVHLLGSGGQSLDVPAGRQVSIGDDGSIGDPADADPADSDEWQKFASGFEEPGGSDSADSVRALNIDQPSREMEELLDQERQTRDDRDIRQEDDLRDDGHDGGDGYKDVYENRLSDNRS